MYAQGEKSTENNRRATANFIGQKKSDETKDFKFAYSHLAVDTRKFHNKRLDIISQRMALGGGAEGSYINRASNNSNILQKVVQRIEFSQAVVGKEYMVLGVKRKLTKIGLGGWLYFEGLSTAFRADKVEEVGASDERGYSSEEGEYSQQIAEDAAEKAEAAKSGRAGQSLRIEQIARLRHKRGGAALGRAAMVSVGEKTYGQSTFVQGTDDQGALHYAATSSSAPFAAWAGQNPFVVRNEFGDGSHVHGEAGLIYHAILNKIQLVHVAVHKPICPVCAAVLRSYGITYDKENVRKEFPSTWGNPFNKEGDPENWQKVNDAAIAAVNGVKATTKILS